MQQSDSHIIAIDYGERRVGIAVAHSVARMPRPLSVLPNDENLLGAVTDIVAQEHASAIVVGLPRNMDGSLGAQAKNSQTFGTRLAGAVSVPIVYVDETLTSVEADHTMHTAKKERGQSANDAVAAAIILERYFEQNQPASKQMGEEE